MEGEQGKEVENPRITAAKEAARRQAPDGVERRSLPGDAVQMAVEYADLGAKTAIATTTAYYTNKLLKRPPKEPTPEIEVQEGYRPKDD